MRRVLRTVSKWTFLTLAQQSRVLIEGIVESVGRRVYLHGVGAVIQRRMKLVLHVQLRDFSEMKCDERSCLSATRQNW